MRFTLLVALSGEPDAQPQIKLNKINKVEFKAICFIIKSRF